MGWYGNDGGGENIDDRSGFDWKMVWKKMDWFKKKGKDKNNVLRIEEKNWKRWNNGERNFWRRECRKYSYEIDDV